MMLITPDDSVMPKMFRTGTEKRASKALASSVGNGDPPVSMQRIELTSTSPTGVAIKVEMTVGTPAKRVAPNCSTTFQ